MKIHIFLTKPKHCVFLHVIFPRKQLDYVWHWLRANSRHGVHSPFVYQLVDEVIYGTQMAEQEIPETLSTQPQKVQQMLGRVLQAHPDFANVFIIDTPNTYADILPQAKPDTVIVVLDIYDSIVLKSMEIDTSSFGRNGYHRLILCRFGLL